MRDELGAKPADSRPRRALALVVSGALGGIAVIAACSAAAPGGQDSTTQTVTNEGATVALGDVVLEIPPGALQGPQTITIRRGAEAAHPGYEAESAVYTFEPDGLVFARPATLSHPGRRFQCERNLV